MTNVFTGQIAMKVLACLTDV